MGNAFGKLLLLVFSSAFIWNYLPTFSFRMFQIVVEILTLLYPGLLSFYYENTMQTMNFLAVGIYLGNVAQRFYLLTICLYKIKFNHFDWEIVFDTEKIYNSDLP